MYAHPLTCVLETSGDSADPRRGADADAGRRVQPWTVQCSFADYSYAMVVVEAATPAEACALAIEAANDSSAWKSLDHCGPTFVDALAQGEDVHPWADHGSIVPVPDEFTETGEAPTVVIVVADGAVRDARIVGGSAPLRLVVITAPDGTAARAAVASLGGSPRLPVRFQPPPAPEPQGAAAPAGERTYHGHRDANGDCHVLVVEADGHRRGLAPRLDLENKSPTGFEWSYAGSGPAQLALALCADALGDDPLALSLYQHFKFAVIARLDRMAPWSMTAAEVRTRCAALANERR